VAAGRGESARALRLAAAVGALGRAQSVVLDAHTGGLLAVAVTTARSGLGAAAASAAEEEGRRFGGPRLLATALDTRAGRDPSPAGTGDRVLTDREGEVAALVGEGLTNRQIARRLHVSERTVHTHLERIRDKLHLPSRAHLVRWIVEETR
jgi:DNA-binding CsgD family transcriptional regulator